MNSPPREILLQYDSFNWRSHFEDRVLNVKMKPMLNFNGTISVMPNVAEEVKSIPSNEPLKGLTADLRLIWCSRENVETKLLRICGQKNLKKFDDVISSNEFKKFVKIGHGSYGEVFSVMNAAKERIVYKIVPVDRKAGEHKISQNSKSLVSDLVIITCLNDLGSSSYENAVFYCDNFPALRGLDYVYSHCDRLLSDNSNSQERSVESHKAQRPRHRHKYVICKMTDCGVTLSSVKILSPSEGIAICSQLIAAFSVAEESIKFEHRDLHLANILLLRTKESQLKYKINNISFEVPIFKWKVTVIDFTFSRISFGEETCVFTDLSNLKISQLKRDSLFDVYENQKSYSKGCWHEFRPKTNVWWLQYAIGEVIKRIEKFFANSLIGDAPSDNEYVGILRSWHKSITSFESCFAFSKAIRLLEEF